MKQTSLAIATLISSASAVDFTVAISTSNQTGNAKWGGNVSTPSVTQQLSSRTAAFRIQSLANLSWGTVVYSVATVATDATPSNFTTVGKVTTSTNASTCMACIGKEDSVWCSRTFGFVTTASTYYTAATTTLSAGLPTSDETTWYSTSANDTGACCNSQALWKGMMTTANLLNPTWTATTGYPNVGQACPAFTTTVDTNGAGNAGKFAVNAFDVASTAWTNWWCTNGLYKNIVKSTSTTDVTRNTVQLMGQNDNNRKELAMVGCPLIAGKCGITTVTKGVYSLVDNTTALVIDVLNNAGPSLNDKCSWVATSTSYAPTFFMSMGGGSKGLTTANWQIHHMEFMTQSGATFTPIDGRLLETPSSNTAGQVSNDSAVGFGNYIPKFTMPQAQFATLRTWYAGDGATKAINAGASQYSTQPSNWFNPYANPTLNTAAANANYATMNTGQSFGNVSNIGVEGYSSTTAVTNIAAGVNYGVNGTGITFDFRQVRYMPAQTAQTVWAAGSALNTLYTAKTTSYATAKTTWNAYVAILKKNAKMDAFAAAFSPPKAPTVPPLPNMPWTPAPYAGYVKQSVQKSAMMYGNQATTTFTTTSQPTAGEFWYSLDAAQSIGGWGVWTAQILTFRAGFGKSFGTLGYSGATGFDSMSQIWNAQAMCGAQFATNGSAQACDSTYTTLGVATAPSAAQTGYRFVTVISLWSAGNNAVSTTAMEYNLLSDFKLTFTGKNWGNNLQALTSITAPTAPTAADSLTGVAGASALAASSAAVLAIAALY